MSAKSRSQRSRKQKTAPAQRNAAGRRAGGRALRVPGLREVYDAVIDCSADLTATADALEAEIWLGANVSSLRADAPDDDVCHLAMLDLIDVAERDGRPDCLVLLKGIAAVGPRGVADAAARAAARLADRAARSAQPSGPDGPPALPRWIDLLGRASVGDCHLWTDAFGEYTQVYCRFAHADGGRAHGLVFTIDHAFRGVLAAIGMVVGAKDLDKLAARLERDARRDGAHYRSTTPADACDQVRAAFVASTDPTLPVLDTRPAPDAEFYAVLPLAVSRLMGMPHGEQPSRPSLVDSWTGPRRQALVDAFFAARPDGWDDPAVARMFAARIVDASIDGLGWPPDRIGPRSAARLFGEVLPASVIAPEALLPHAGHVAQVWVGWLVAPLDLPNKAHRALRRSALTALALYPLRCRDWRANPHFPYVAELPTHQADGPSLQQVLTRRTFAVPLPGERGDGIVDLDEPANGLDAGHTHVDDLDAADPTHRSLITAIGQSVAGTHADRIAAVVGIVEQLWHNEPAAAWQAAERLQAARLPRQRILQRLAEVWQRHGPDTPHGLTARPDPETCESYAAALRTLGSVPQRRR